MVRGREGDYPQAPRPQLSDDDIDWVHDKRAEERLVEALVKKRFTWATVIAAVIGTMFGVLSYFKGGHP